MDLVGPQGARGIAALMGTPEAATRAGLVTTIVGTGSLLFAAVGVVAQLRSALNAVWRVEAPPMSWGTLARGYVFNVGLIIATGFLLLVSLVASAMLSAATASARHWMPGPDALWFGVDAAVGLAMTGGLFALMFKHVPDTDVRWSDALAGAAVSAVLFTAGRVALAGFLGRAAADSAYDAAGSVLALLAWVYYSAQLVLVGAEFAVACERLRAERAGSAHRPART
jgi:membrane protein